MIPWDLIYKKYSKQFKGSIAGNPAKAARMAFWSHIIKEKYGLSDDETVEHIKESPYLQWFIGMPKFSHKAPFDGSTMTWFRKRLTPEMLTEKQQNRLVTIKKVYAPVEFGAKISVSMVDGFAANFKNMGKHHFHVQDYDKRVADQRITAFVQQHLTIINK